MGGIDPGYARANRIRMESPDGKAGDARSRTPGDVKGPEASLDSSVVPGPTWGSGELGARVSSGAVIGFNDLLRGSLP